MNIQTRFEYDLQNAMKCRLDNKLVDNLRFLKAELQRGKNKIVSDQEATMILVRLINSQRELVTNSNVDVITSVEAIDLIRLIETFLPQEIVAQIYITEDGIREWIEKNVDLSSLKSYNQVIGMVKKKMPFVDGTLVKNVVESLKE